MDELVDFRVSLRDDHDEGSRHMRVSEVRCACLVCGVQFV